MFTYEYDHYLIDQANYKMGGSNFLDDNWQKFTEEDWEDYENYLNNKNNNNGYDNGSN